MDGKLQAIPWEQSDDALSAERTILAAQLRFVCDQRRLRR
jgi:hypothetical protein